MPAAVPPNPLADAYALPAAAVAERLEVDPATGLDATEAAHRLGITRVTSTDFIRQTMRTFFSKEFMPSVHYSSFEARLALTRAEEEESGDAAILGFLDQTRNVLVGVDAALERAAEIGVTLPASGRVSASAAPG